MFRIFVVALSALGAIAVGTVVGGASASADPPYANCSDAHADGRYDIPRDDPGYAPKLDRDHDGIACES